MLLNVVKPGATTARPAINFISADARHSAIGSARAMLMVTRSYAVRHGCGPLAGLMRGTGLYPVYQPIVSLLSDGIILFLFENL